MPIVEDKSGRLIGVMARYGVSPEGKPYPPHPTQRRVIDLIKEYQSGSRKTIGGGIPVIYIQHGVNSGGTRAALAPIIDYFVHTPNISILIGRKDYNDLRRSVMQDWFEIMTDAGMRLLDSDEQLHEYTYAVMGGKSKVFFSDLKDAGGLGSQQFPAIMVSEAYEITYEVYQALKRRCRKAGLPSFMILEGNPPRENHWLNMLTKPGSTFYDPDVERIEINSFENAEFMSQEYKTMLQNMPSAWRRRFVEAKAVPLPSGTPVYSGFCEEVHVQPTFLIPDRPVLRFFDFGFRYAACLWNQRDAGNRLFIHHEWMPFETPEDQFIDLVIVKTNEYYGSLPVIDYGDPAALQRDPQGISTLRRLSDRGIKLNWRVTTYEDRIPLINQRFSFCPKGEPSVVIDPRCNILIEALAGGYHYREVREGQVWTPKQELPERDGYYEHIANAMEYGMVNLYMVSNEHQREQHRRFRFARRIEKSRRHGVVSF